MNTAVIDGKLYTAMVKSGAARLGQCRATVNDLNVFPIPDGDTGDNMYMTIRAGAYIGCTSEDLGRVSEAVSGGMLTGARGNSGVILSRIFAGIAKYLYGTDTADVRVFARAMQKGVEEAYAAVNQPVEGTILTVYRESVTSAAENLRPDADFSTYFSDLLREAKASLERTPDLLDVLKEAGVVDSGGAGLLYILQGMLNALEGHADTCEDAPAPAQKGPDLSLFDENSVLEFGYCTEFLLRLQTSKVDLATFDETELFDWLNAHGESVVAFRDGSIVKVHVHTHTPGEILNHCQKYGEYLTLKIENMTLQHNENRPAEPKDEKEPQLRRKVRKKFGTVAVACGDGVREMFSSLGTDAVIDGGQSMNPSAGDFIAAFDTVNADTVFVFPNNANVVLAARQAAEMYKSADIRVLETKTVGEGYAAMSMLDLSMGSADELEEAIRESYADVVTGFVSRASRDAETNGIVIHTGDFLGFSGKNVLANDKDRNGAALRLCETLQAGKRDVLILLRGADTPQEEAEALADALQKQYPRTEIIPTDGGQPIHDYILILE